VVEVEQVKIQELHQLYILVDNLVVLVVGVHTLHPRLDLEILHQHHHHKEILAEQDNPLQEMQLVEVVLEHQVLMDLLLEVDLVE
jgi:hypothetical protein